MKKILLTIFILFLCVSIVPVCNSATYDATGYWDATYTFQWIETPGVNINFEPGLPKPMDIYINQDSFNDTFEYRIYGRELGYPIPDHLTPNTFGSIIDDQYFRISNIIPSTPSIIDTFPEHAITGSFLPVQWPGGPAWNTIVDVSDFSALLTSGTQMTGSWLVTVSNKRTLSFDPDEFLFDPSVWVTDSGFIFENWVGHIEFNAAKASSAPVPEPATMLLLGTGLIGLAGARRKRRK